jgi:ferrous iron transport protein B
MSPETIHVTLAGNPNSGKTSIFNNLTGSNQRVANYPGVTVETIEGAREHQGVRYRIVDLPGTYSLTANSPEERIARNYLLEGRPDVVVQVVDASNLERSLYLTLQLLELGVRVVLDLNMIDEAEARGIRIDLEALGGALGVEVVATIGHRNVGTGQLLEAVARARRRAPKALDLRYPDVIETLAGALTEQIHRSNGQSHLFPARWAAIRYLEGDGEVRQWVNVALRGGPALSRDFERRLQALQALAGESAESMIAGSRYGMIGGILQDVFVRGEAGGGRNLSDRIDAVLLHRVWGLPLLLIMMYGLFQFVFTLGQPFMDWIEAGFGALGGLIVTRLADGPLRSLLIDGIIGGVGMVIVFLPNILLLFFALGLMERSGYLARAAFLLDRLLNGIGLHGRSFVPLLTGFGCSIPAIMATRTLEHERDRLATMMVIPLMSCSARLPIYMLLVPAFFPLKYQGLMFILMYGIGIALAIAMVKLLRVTILSGDSTPFVMELPPYRWPTLRSVASDMQQKSMQYLRKAGTIILAVAIVLWVATSYPRKPQYEIDRSPAAAAMSAAALEQARAGEDIAYSVAGRVGHAMEPIFAPLGFDWRICTALVGALAAREVFVAQLGIVYSVGDAESNVAALRRTLAERYTPLQALCMMLFCLISILCMSTFAIMRRESNSWKWPTLQWVGLTALAYVVTLIVYQVGSRLG